MGQPAPIRSRGLLSRKWRGLRRFLRSRIRFWIDLDSLRSAINYLMASGRLRRRGVQVVPIGFRSTRGTPILCRVGTTDSAVVRDTFGGLYQLPPRSIKNIRQILDLGSNIGATMVHYGHLFPNSRILGVELDRGNYDLSLQNTCHLGDRCKVLWGGVWKTDGEVRYQGSEKWGFHISPESEGISAPAFSMSTILKQVVGPVDFMKMDIEGAEQELLKQASEWVDRVRCMKIEIHPPYSVEDCMSDLAAAGFRPVRDPDQDNEVLAFNPRFHQDSATPGQRRPVSLSRGRLST
jgi:FkbM family methyltransferase